MTKTLQKLMEDISWIQGGDDNTSNPSTSESNATDIQPVATSTNNFSYCVANDSISPAHGQPSWVANDFNDPHARDSKPPLTPYGIDNQSSHIIKDLSSTDAYNQSFPIFNDLTSTDAKDNHLTYIVNDLNSTDAIDNDSSHTVNDPTSANAINGQSHNAAKDPNSHYATDESYRVPIDPNSSGATDNQLSDFVKGPHSPDTTHDHSSYVANDLNSLDATINQSSNISENPSSPDTNVNLPACMSDDNMSDIYDDGNYDDLDYVPDSDNDSDVDSEVLSFLNVEMSKRKKNRKDINLIDGNTNMDGNKSEDENISQESLGCVACVSDSDSNEEDIPRNLKEADIIRDKNYKRIYIRRHRKSCKASSAQAGKKKLDRVYDNYHACLVCGQLRLHINVHAKTHDSDARVKEILKQKRPDFQSFRKLGDDKHNQAVLRKKKGELLIARRSTADELDISQYGPCPNCREWLLLKCIKDHFKKCTKDKFCPSTKALKNQSMIIGGFIDASHSKVMVSEVFPSMRNDVIGKTAITDELILALGESWLKRSVDNKEKRHRYASQHMRLMARLLLELITMCGMENNDPKPSMSTFLTVSHFDHLVDGSIRCCMPEMDDIEDLRSPSNALKLKYDINRMLDTKWGWAVKRHSHEEADDCWKVMKLMKKQWSERVTKLARTILNCRQFENPKDLPSPEDIQKLSLYLDNKLSGTKPDPCTFHCLVAHILARLVLFNRCRTGEIEVIKLDRYESRVSELSDLDASLANNLTDVEKRLLTSQELMTIRGKNSRPVPVIIPTDCKAPLDFIASAEARKAAGIPMSNRYLFPSTVGTHAKAYTCLKMVCEDVGLKAPQNITSVNIRKYTATLTQTMNLKSSEFEWFMNHLGHTGDVHKQHCRQLSGLLERVYISKLLLVQDMNLTAKYANQDLREMDIRDIVMNCEDLQGGHTNELALEEEEHCG